MKLGLKIKDNGTVELCVAATGEEIEGVQYITSKSGVECATEAKVILRIYDKDGRDALG